MELVYLWIEKYKNIENCGFNFSPKYQCKYDDQTNELVIKKSDDYIENFFGDNINVSAIIGKNGSGKSNLLDLIQMKYYENPLKSPYPVSFPDLKEIRIYKSKDSNKLYRYQNKISVSINSKLTIIEMKNINHNLTNTIFIKPTPLHKQEEYIQLLDFLINNKKINFPFRIPQFINIGIHDDYYELLDIIKSNEFDIHKFYSVFDEKKDKRIMIFHVLLLIAYMKNYNIKFSIKAKKNIKKTIQELEDNIPDSSILHQIKSFIEIISNNLENFSEVTSHYININKLPSNFFKIYMQIIKRKNKEKILDFKGKKVFGFEFFQPLSDGEYQSTYLFSQIYSEGTKDNNIQLLMDEGENFMHPNWQKKYLSNLIYFLRNNYSIKNIHIFLTSHSPFLLSDIPKQNIIFLDKDKNGNCKVVDGLKEKKQTFGANIHTLLSDGFFMEDGLMGEFAKDKIQQIMNILNGKPSSYNYRFRYIFTNKYHFHLMSKNIKKVIEAIGEPFLKEKLLKMYFDKFDDEKESRIKELKAELKRLEK